MNVEERIRTTNPIPLRKRTIIHLMLVHNHVNEIINNTLKPFDISLQQFNVLRILRGRKGPANLSTLNERMVTRMSNTTRLVDKLVRKGYVDRVVCPTNRRKVEITVTDSGIKVLGEMDLAMDAAEECILNDFTKQELAALNRLFDKF